jgi:hypothetical protein
MKVRYKRVVLFMKTSFIYPSTDPDTDPTYCHTLLHLYNLVCLVFQSDEIIPCNALVFLRMLILLFPTPRMDTGWQGQL